MPITSTSNILKKSVLAGAIGVSLMAATGAVASSSSAASVGFNESSHNHQGDEEANDRHHKHTDIDVEDLLASGLLHHHHGANCQHDTPQMRRALHGQLAASDDSVPADANYRVVEMGRRRPKTTVTSTSNGRSTTVEVEGPEEVLTTAVTRQTYADDADNNNGINGLGFRGSRRKFNAAAAGDNTTTTTTSAAAPSSSRRDTTNDLPIRVVFDTSHLYDTSKYCTSNTTTSPTFDGYIMQCNTEDIFTEADRQMLIEHVIPKAQDMLASILSVARVSGNLQVYNRAVCGSQYNIPNSHITTGVANADFLVYVTAGPTDSGVVAWAGYCSVDQNGRPVVARMNMSPVYLRPASQTDFNNMIRTVLHELTHALGFSGYYISSEMFEQQNVVWTTTKRGGQPVTMYSGTAALDAAKKHFNCYDLEGVEIEDEGGEGSVASHWERRFHKTDLMAAVVNDVMALSAITYGLLEDSGHYSVDHSKLEAVQYMNNAGCSVSENKCNTEAGGLNTYFCNDLTQMDLCSDDFTEIGICYVGNYASALPSWGQYFAQSSTLGGSQSYFDYCPVVMGWSNRLCNRWDNTAANNTNTALYYGSDGRCFPTTPTLYNGPSSTNWGEARCFQSRCVMGERIEFKVGNVDTWVQCPTDGTAGVVNAPSPYTGQITCPVAFRFCTADLFFDDGSTRRPTTTPAPTTTRATVPRTTTAKGATTTRPATAAATVAPRTTRAIVSAAPPTVMGLVSAQLIAVVSVALSAFFAVI